MKANTEQAFQLLHDGAIALSQVESNGIRIDTKHLESARKKAAKKKEEHKELIMQDPLYKVWKKRFGQKTKPTAGNQLGYVVFEHLQYDVKKRTESGKYSTDASSLEEVDLPIVKNYLALQKWDKADGTFLNGIEKETTNGFLHPIFNLNTVQTFRSSSQRPNFQNFPVRDPLVAEVIRKCFVARKGHQLCEVDYGGIEVCSSCFYHEDPALMKYVKDTTTDMHRDLAAQCYLLKPKQVNKIVRYCGKNQFIFPQFYGDVYYKCAKALWESLATLDLKVGDSDMSLKKHLKKKGITKRGRCVAGKDPQEGSFEEHIKEVENHFWKKRFKVYDAWKEEWFRQYKKKGKFQTLTGFEISGLFRKNQVINYPVQCVAFHCLLLALILLSIELKKRKMKTKIVGQIHDSIVADVHKKELDDYLQLAKEIMTERVPSIWKWINVPLTVDAEVSPLGGSWYDKQEVKLD